MPRPIADDYDDKRRQIMAAAAHLFATQGYAGAGMAAVAAEAGISKGNIYHYYGGKEDLLFAILDAYLSDLRDQICGLSLPDEPEAALRLTLRAILRAYKGEDDMHKVQVNDLNALPAERQKPLKAYQRDILRFVADRLAPFGTGDMRDVTMSVFGMLNWFYMWNAGADDDARDAYADTVCDLVLGGLPRLQCSS